MAERSVIRKGDRTSHGGVVVTGDESVMIFGQPMARLGDRVTCPMCAGQHVIVEGTPGVSSDRRTALEGMKTSCGATLIASQDLAVLDPGPGDIARASDDADTLENGRFGGGAEPAHRISTGLRHDDCDHIDTAIPLAHYMVREMKTNPFSIEGRKIAAANRADPSARRAEWQQLPWYLRLGGVPDFDGAAAGRKVAAYGMWAERVGPGRPWDHKPILLRKFPGTLEVGWHTYRGYEYYYDIWSNIHYGYVGVALGFTAAELINGAGLAQSLDDLRNKKPQQRHPEQGSWPASADDVPDHISIKLGTELYGEVKPHALTVERLLHGIAAVPAPWGAGRDRAKRVHDCKGS